MHNKSRRGERASSNITAGNRFSLFKYINVCRRELLLQGVGKVKNLDVADLPLLQSLKS